MSTFANSEDPDNTDLTLCIWQSHDRPVGSNYRFGGGGGHT